VVGSRVGLTGSTNTISDADAQDWLPFASERYHPSYPEAKKLIIIFAAGLLEVHNGWL
jgi:hypothetical protein